LRGDGRDLLGGLSLAEYDLRKTLARVPVVVDPGEPEIVVRLLAQELKEGFQCRLRRQIAGADPAEQFPQLLSVHRIRETRGMGGKTAEFVDLRQSSTVI
jgi:hypothetical protein